METIVVEGRVMYPDVINPSRFKDQRTGADQWMIQVMIPKSDKGQMGRIVEAIQTNDRAISQYGANLDFDANAEVTGITKDGGNWRNQPIRDGDSNRYPADANGHWVLHAKTQNPRFTEGVFDGQLNKVIDAAMFYSGCVCKIGIGVKCYNAAGNRGIGWFLNGVQFIKSGQKIALGNVPNIDDLFSKIPGSETAAGVGASPFTGEPAESVDNAGSFLD